MCGLASAPKRPESCRVSDVMTRPVWAATPDMDLVAAARLMQEHGCGTLPVLDRHGTLVGIVTDRDICMALVTSHRGARHIAVREAMTSSVVTCRGDQSVQEALGTMSRAQVRRLPVVTSEGALAGLLSIDDIVLRGLTSSSGVSDRAFLDALRAVCAPREVDELVGVDD